MNIEKEIAHVFNGFLNLTDSQKIKFLGIVKDYQSGNHISNESLRESVHDSVTKMQTGPYRETCTCCGR